MIETITEQGLRLLSRTWLENGCHVAGPSEVTKGNVLYIPIIEAQQLSLTNWIHPRNSAKEFFFPKTEKLYGYQFKGKEVSLMDWADQARPCLLLGVRPCDAAALPLLDHVFNWDFKDPFYNRRRNLTTIVTIACTQWDEDCFCTNVGLGPAAESGSDVMLYPLGEDVYEVRCLTEKGNIAFQGKTQSMDRPSSTPAVGPPKKLDFETIRKRLETNFDDPFWQASTSRCLGCSACSYVCPTCHCFDIVDEGNAQGGCRVKNWDSCQFAMFTHHASGHNPRTCQAHRQRQRAQHKFRIYPEKFGEILCTGCGNCMRQCPVGLGVMDALEGLSQASITQEIAEPQSIEISSVKG